MYFSSWATKDHVIVDLRSDDESGDWEEGAEGALATLVGVRAEIAEGDLHPLYLAWPSALGAWDAMGDDEEEFRSGVEASVPAGLATLALCARCSSRDASAGR